MPPSNTKSEGQIIKENVLTFFNLIFLVLALCLCLVGSFKNLMFLLVAVANTVVGSFQEIRAKRAVDKLTLVAAGTAKAIRSGQRVSVRTDQLVRDDIVEFAAGDQICADAVVRDGQLQVNESLLTGEADAILKNPGDTLKSGSFVISGRARVQLTHVGSESYAAKLAAEARRNVRSTKSEMMLSLHKAHHGRRHRAHPARHHPVPASFPVRVPGPAAARLRGIHGLGPDRHDPGGPLPADERRHRGQLPEALAQARAACRI